MKHQATKDRTGDPDAVDRALSESPDWITRELVEETLRIWQPFYKEPLIPNDALEILSGVGRLLEVLSSGDSHETVRRSGSR